MAEMIAPYIITYIAGIASGVGVEYCAQLLTDRRRTREQRNAADAEWKALVEKMPLLLREMADDQRSRAGALVQEFYVFERELALVHGQKQRFIYFRDDHESLDDKVQLLASRGLVEPIRVSDICPVYRMTESFVDLLATLPITG